MPDMSNKMIVSNRSAQSERDQSITGESNREKVEKKMIMLKCGLFFTDDRFSSHQYFAKTVLLLCTG